MGYWKNKFSYVEVSINENNDHRHINVPHCHSTCWLIILCVHHSVCISIKYVEMFSSLVRVHLFLNIVTNLSKCLHADQSVYMSAANLYVQLLVLVFISQSKYSLRSVYMSTVFSIYLCVDLSVYIHACIYTAYISVKNLNTFWTPFCKTSETRNSVLNINCVPVLNIICASFERYVCTPWPQSISIWNISLWAKLYTVTPPRTAILCSMIGL